MAKTLLRLFIASCGLFVVIAVVGGVYYFGIIGKLMAAPAQGMPPMAVTTMPARQEQWDSKIETVGSITSVQGTMVAAEADGVVREIAFAPGSTVEAGALLVKLDTDIEDAQLRAAEAAADWARVSFKRAQELFADKTVSQSELDSADAAVKQAEAQADNIRALIARKNIRAPFAGRLGIREINLGQYVNRGTGVVSLQSLSPIFVEFALPQQFLSQLREGLRVNLTTDAFPGETFTGTITALNPQVDPATRNMRIQATVPNADGRLRPGMFTEIDVMLPEKRDVVIVPLTAVLKSTHGTTVFVVEAGPAGPDGNPTLVAKHRLVRTGEARGDFVVITEGLRADERVVTSGAFKLRDDAAVFESPVGTTPPSLEPKAGNS